MKELYWKGEKQARMGLLEFIEVLKVCVVFLSILFVLNSYNSFISLHMIVK